MFSSNNFLQLLVIPKEISFVVGHSSFLSFLQKSNLLFNGNIFPIWPNNCFQTRINNRNKNINEPPWGHSLTYQNKRKSILFPKIFFPNQWSVIWSDLLGINLYPQPGIERWKKSPLYLPTNRGIFFCFFTHSLSSSSSSSSSSSLLHHDHRKCAFFFFFWFHVEPHPCLCNPLLNWSSIMTQRSHPISFVKLFPTISNPFLATQPTKSLEEFFFLSQKVTTLTKIQIFSQILKKTRPKIGLKWCAIGAVQS